MSCKSITCDNLTKPAKIYRKNKKIYNIPQFNLIKYMNKLDR